MADLPLPHASTALWLDDEETVRNRWRTLVTARRNRYNADGTADGQGLHRRHHRRPRLRQRGPAHRPGLRLRRFGRGFQIAGAWIGAAANYALYRNKCLYAYISYSG